MDYLKKWVKYNQFLRDKVVDKSDSDTKILLTNFAGTAQAQDIQKRTDLLGSNFYRIKVNVKPFAEDEKKRGKGVILIDFHDEQAVFNSIKTNFDSPYWAFTSLPDKTTLQNYNDIFIWQLKACNFKCPWCYVDDESNTAKKTKGAEFFSIPEIINAFEKEREKYELNMIRGSGGEPTLAIEQWLETLNELENRNLQESVFLQGDTNLSTGEFIKHLDETDQISPFLLHEIGNYDNFGLLCSFKGTDTESFLKASGFTKSDGTLNNNYGFLEKHRWETFNMYVEAGIDVYPFIYDPNPKTLEAFMNKGAKFFGDGFYLKTWMFPLKLYSPEQDRLDKIGKSEEEFQSELDENFKQSEEIMNNLIYKNFKVNYQSIPRTGIKLKSNEILSF